MQWNTVFQRARKFNEDDNLFRFWVSYNVWSERCVVEAISGGKISPASRLKRKTQSFLYLRRSLDTRGLGVWREEGRLIAFVPSGTSPMKGAVTQCQWQRNFLSWHLTKNLVNTFASIPISSYVAKDTFLARAKFLSILWLSETKHLNCF